MSTLKVGTIADHANGNSAITIDSSGNTSIPSGRVLNAPGHILQVKQSFIDTVITSGSTSFVTSGVAVVITPTSTSSKILLTSSIGGFYMAQNDDIYATIYRGSTNLGVGTANCFFYVHNDNAQARYGSGSMEFLDSPNTTSATTYTIFYRTGNSTAVQINRADTGLFLTAMEVGG